jgi:hypothetical protein
MNHRIDDILGLMGVNHGPSSLDALSPHDNSDKNKDVIEVKMLNQNIFEQPSYRSNSTLNRLNTKMMMSNNSFVNTNDSILALENMVKDFEKRSQTHFADLNFKVTEL